MIDIQSQNRRTGDSWEAAPSRAAGLYGELQPMPIPAAAPVSTALTRKPKARPASMD